MKILFVAMSESVHTCRWIEQIADEGWDLHLFPSNDYGHIYSEMRGITVHHSVYSSPPPNDVQVTGFRLGSPVFRGRVDLLGRGIRRSLRSLTPDYRVAQLARLIRHLKPDILHMMEFSTTSRLTLTALRRLSADERPIWVVSNWGPALLFWKKLAEHRAAIEAVMAEADYYTCECERDVLPVRETAFTGGMLPVLLSGGAFDVAHVARFGQGAPSSRRLIVIKGYQGVMGRSLVALRALEYVRQELAGYRICLYSVFDPSVRVAVELLAQRGIDIYIQEHLPTNDDMLRLFGQARVYIGLSIADGVSTASIQAMMTGAFPIQSDTACTNEWIVDGETGTMVPAEDPQIVADALRRALTDDRLVDRAAQRNLEICRARADISVVRPKVVEMYRQVAEQGKKRR